jgi:integrase
MASLWQRGESWVVTVTVGRKRPNITLGALSTGKAQQVHRHIQELEDCRRNGLSRIDPATRGWLDSIDDGLHGRIVSAGLVEERVEEVEQVTTLDELIEAFKVREPAAKASTAAAREQTFRSVRDYFGGLRDIRTIGAGEVDEWFAGELKAKARATASKRGQVFKRLLERAVRWEMLEKSPAGHLRMPEQRNPDRQEYVEWGVIERVLVGMSDVEWRCIVALSRLAGLRVPTEIVNLTWADVDWGANIITIRASKTKTRACPIFPELLPFLRDQFEATPAGEVNVIHRHRLGGGNYATQFKRFILKAGVKVWPRLWHNLRASRATELAGAYPGHVAAAWLGHSEKIADRHYRSVRVDDFAKGATVPTIAGWTPAGHVSADDSAKGKQAGTNGHKAKAEKLPENEENPSICGGFEGEELGELVGGTGLEQWRYSQRIRCGR